MAGAIYILPPERVRPVDVPFTVALKVFSKWGAGAGEFVRAMQAAKPSQAASSAVQSTMAIYSRAAEFRQIWYRPEGVAESS